MMFWQLVWRYMANDVYNSCYSTHLYIGNHELYGNLHMHGPMFRGIHVLLLHAYSERSD